MNIKLIRDKIVSNPIIGFLYKGMGYSDRGRGIASKFYGPLPELMIVIGFMKFILNINFTIPELCIWILDVYVFFILMGYAYTILGFWKKERKVQTNMDPIQKVIYEAAQIIIANDKVRQK
jgi:hypothetical protein